MPRPVAPSARATADGSEPDRTAGFADEAFGDEDFVDEDFAEDAFLGRDDAEDLVAMLRD